MPLRVTSRAPRPRSARSFIEAYDPAEFLVINTGLEHQYRLGSTVLRWIVPEDLPEATALDLVRYYKAAGHLNHVATVLEELAENMDREALVRAAEAGGFEMVVVQRLGYLLDLVGAREVTEGLAALVAEKAPQAVPLRPDLSHKGCSVDTRWRVAVNDEVESDL